MLKQHRKNKYVLSTVLALFLSFTAGVKSTPAEETRQENSVYIVPDLETFLYTISRWDRDRQFPVFIGWTRFAEKFCDAYPDAAIVNAPKARYIQVDADTVLKALYAAWGPETLYDIKKKITAADIKKRLAKIGAAPRGIVLTRLGDQELAGGILLAAYHKQLLDFLDVAVEKVRNEKGEMVEKGFSATDKEKIRETVIGKIRTWGYDYRGTGSGIDYITLAMNIPYTYQGLSLDDAINREEPAGVSVYAYTGRLVDENSGMALYQANCAAFLTAGKALLFDRWPANWNYGMAEAQWNFLKYIPAVLYEPATASMERWRSLMRKGNVHDIVFIQSSGGAKNWQDGTVNDVPDSVPAIVYFSHSGSAANIHDINTIAGRWLYNGAYVYVGAMAEPQNRAFQKPALMSAAITEGNPLGMAFQRKETLMRRFAVPWRLVYIGDPLCTVRLEAAPDEAVSFALFQKGFRKLRDMNFNAAMNFFEQFLAAFPRSDLARTAADYLKKTYLLKFYEYISQKFPIQKYISNAFLQNWYCGAPSEALALRESLPYAQDRALKFFYKNLYATRGANRAAAAIIRDETAALNKTIPFLKEWAVTGPFAASDEEKHPALSDPAHLSAGKPVVIGRTAYPWNIIHTERTTHALSLQSPRQTDSNSFAYALAVLISKGDRRALLKVASPSRFVLYINRRKVFDSLGAPRAADNLFRLDAGLRNGLNELLVKTYRGNGSWSLAMSVHSLGGGPADYFVAVPLEKFARPHTPVKPPAQKPAGPPTFTPILQETAEGPAQDPPWKQP